MDSLAPSWVPIAMALGRRYPAVLPALAKASAMVRLEGRASPPFGRRHAASLARDLLPSAPQGASRSVLFLHNAYYHYYYLARALRRRGWDAVLATIHDPASSTAPYFHGEDVNLFTPDPQQLEERLSSVFGVVSDRFRMVHFAGVHHMSLFPTNFDHAGWVGTVPWDFMEFKRRGVKVGYTVSGCNDGVSQSAVSDHTGICSKCVWQLYPKVCSDGPNRAWGRKLSALCDLLCVDGDWALESRCGPSAFREPLTTCLDPEVWKPDLTVPARLRIERSDSDVLLLHGFGNKDLRTRHGRDIKGSWAIRAAAERLASEGARVRLITPENVPSQDMRYLQVQADIIVDQLNYGRYGAQAREGLMLGKPTVCYLDNRQGPGLLPLRSLRECPLVSASESTIYDVLKRLVSDAAERRRIGEASRRYAIKWHSADACALRFERVYDRLMLGLPPEADEVFDEFAEQPCAA